MEDAPTFGQRVREIRKTRNLTQRELAGRVATRLREADRRGFDITYLSKIENGRMPPPSRAAILQIAVELDADSDELLYLAGKVPPDIEQTLQESVGARVFYRSARNFHLSEEDWRKLLEALERLESRKRT